MGLLTFFSNLAFFNDFDVDIVFINDYIYENKQKLIYLLLRWWRRDEGAGYSWSRLQTLLVIYYNYLQTKLIKLHLLLYS